MEGVFFHADAQAQILSAAVAVVKEPRRSDSPHFGAGDKEFFPRQVWLLAQFAGRPNLERMERQQVPIVSQSQTRILISPVERGKLRVRKRGVIFFKPCLEIAFARADAPGKEQNGQTALGVALAKHAPNDFFGSLVGIVLIRPAQRLARFFLADFLEHFLPLRVCRIRQHVGRIIRQAGSMVTHQVTHQANENQVG